MHSESKTKGKQKGLELFYSRAGNKFHAFDFKFAKKMKLLSTRKWSLTMPFVFDFKQKQTYFNTVKI